MRVEAVAGLIASVSTDTNVINNMATAIQFAGAGGAEAGFTFKNNSGFNAVVTNVPGNVISGGDAQIF